MSDSSHFSALKARDPKEQRSKRSSFVETLEPRRLFANGADVPYVTHEAENGAYTGVVLGPSFAANTVAAESSGRKAVRLNSPGQYVQVSATTPANSVVVRYSIPDAANGLGQDATLSLYVNGVFQQKLSLTSKLTWQYGEPSASTANTPSVGAPRNFYDEVRVKNVTINAGDTVRVQRDSDASDVAVAYDDIDLIDLENVVAPLAQPANSLSVMAYGAVGNGIADDTAAVRNTINAAIGQGKTVWVPAGSYKLTSFIYSIREVTIQGAGMWHTTFVGDVARYNNTAAASNRIGLMGGGNNVHLNDFAITGSLNHRTDTEDNDAIGGFFGTGSSLNNVWIEHTKVGVWIRDTLGMTISNLRVRNLLADGVNLYRGVRSTTVSNSDARGTGDDAFATFPAYDANQFYSPGFNVFTHITAIAVYRANGIGIYGGESNSVDHGLFRDIPYGSAVLLSTTFFNQGGVAAQTNFSGTTRVSDCDLIRAGGIETFAALQFALTNAPMSGVALSNLRLIDNAFDGIRVYGNKLLTNATATNLTIARTGLAGPVMSYGVFVESALPSGSFSISNSRISDYGNLSSSFKLGLSSITGQLPAPWIAGDIRGNAAFVGATNITSTAITIDAYGAGIRSTSDGFRFVSQSVAGDHTLTARLDSLQTGTAPQAGLMVRNDASAGSPLIGLLATPTSGISLVARATANGSLTTFATNAAVRAPALLRLARTGDAFTAFYSTNDGSTWTQLGTTLTLVLNTNALAGLAATSGTTSNKVRAVFSQFKLRVPYRQLSPFDATPVAASPPLARVSHTSQSHRATAALLGEQSLAKEGHSPLLEISGTEVFS